MSKLVLIDGENLLHILRKVLSITGPEMDRDKLLNYPLRRLITETCDIALDDEVIYFGTKINIPSTPMHLKQKAEKARDFQAKWVNSLTNQGIVFEKSGYLRIREGEPCINCGASRPYMAEKGVDVALAVRLVLDSTRYDEIVVVSSDTDLLPAIKAAIDLGGSVTYLGLEDNIILALAGNATKTRVITQKLIAYLYKEANK